MMAHYRQYGWLVAVGIGVVGGLILGGFWPHTPLYAVATDRINTFRHGFRRPFTR